MVFSFAGKNRTGFGLLEILATVSICILVAVLLVPNFDRWRRQAQSARCTSNLRQIGIGLQLYMQDQGSFPPFAWYGDVTRWFDGSADSNSFFAGPYLNTAPRLQQNLALLPASVGGIFDCPSITAKEKAGRGTSAFIRESFDYGLNISLSGRRTHALPAPSRTVAVVDGGNYGRVKAQWMNGLTYTPDATASPGGVAWNSPLSPIIYPHNGMANFLFLDGHVGAHRPQDVSESWFSGAF